MTWHGIITKHGRREEFREGKQSREKPSVSPFREEILEMDHLHHDGHILLSSRAQVVFDVTLSLELEHHLLNGHTLPADAAELVP